MLLSDNSKKKKTEDNVYLVMLSLLFSLSFFFFGCVPESI